MKLQFGAPQFPKWRGTPRAGGAVRHTNGDLLIFRPVFRLRLSPQELLTYDALGAKLQPLMLEKMAAQGSRRLLDSRVSGPGCTRCLQLRHASGACPTAVNHSDSEPMRKIVTRRQLN